MCYVFLWSFLSGGLSQLTHSHGGTLDVVFSPVSHPLEISIFDPGLSDHSLVSWKSQLPLPPLQYIAPPCTTKIRPWNRLHLSDLREKLLHSPLCSSISWLSFCVDDLSVLYDVTITSILDDIIPMKTSRCSRRPSNPWFDAECRELKRLVRRLERYVISSHSPSSDLCHYLKSCRHEYLSVLRSKKQSYWRSRVFSQRNSPRKLWRSFASLLGRCSNPLIPPSVSPTDLLDFFQSKVASVRQKTVSFCSPTFSAAPDGCCLSDFKPVSQMEVLRFIGRLPDNHSKTDPIPNCFLKQCADSSF